MKRCLYALLVVLLMPACVPYSTDSTEVGVRVNSLTGLEQEVYPPGGTYFFMPFITDWYTFSTQSQTLKMLANANEGDREGRDDLEFKTLDGNDVAIDVTVIYRLQPAKAPFILQRVAESDQELKERIIRPLSRSLIRDVLNELSSEDIYAGKKFQAATQAQALLNETLLLYGIQCDNIILGDHRFHERYQKAINDKKVYDQQVNTNRSSAENAKQEWEARLEKTRGDVEQLLATEAGNAQQLKLEADAYFVSKQREAEAILAEKKALAEGIQKMSEAMSGAGGRVMVKRRIAEKLKGKRIVVLPGGGGDVGVQKLDVNALLQTYGLSEPSKPRPATTEETP